MAKESSKSTVVLTLKWAGTMDKDSRYTFSAPVEEAIRNIVREEIDRKEKGLPQKRVPPEGEPKVPE